MAHELIVPSRLKHVQQHFPQTRSLVVSQDLYPGLSLGCAVPVPVPAPKHDSWHV